MILLSSNIHFRAVKTKRFVIKGGHYVFSCWRQRVCVEMEISALLVRLITWLNSYSRRNGFRESSRSVVCAY